MGFMIGGALISTIFSIVFIFWLEKKRRPVLFLEIEPTPPDLRYPTGRPAQRHKALRLLVKNKSLATPLKWFMARETAINCRANISFYHLNDGQDVFGRSMHGRWANSPQPVPMEARSLNGQLSFLIIDVNQMRMESRIDIYPGEQEELDIAARFDNETEAYGWNNEAYFSSTPWRSAQWQLGSNRYLVKVSVTAGNAECSGIFRIINDVSIDSFRLELANKTDKDRLG